MLVNSIVQHATARWLLWSVEQCNYLQMGPRPINAVLVCDEPQPSIVISCRLCRSLVLRLSSALPRNSTENYSVQSSFISTPLHQYTCNINQRTGSLITFHSLEFYFIHHMEANSEDHMSGLILFLLSVLFLEHLGRHVLVRYRHFWFLLYNTNWYNKVATLVDFFPFLFLLFNFYVI